MKFEYESENLIYRILGAESADVVLDFYAKNSAFFEVFEPTHNSQYFTKEYHETLLRMEQEQFLRNLGGRFWIYEKKAPSIICGCVAFSHVVRGCFAKADVAYKVAMDRQNLGIGTEALTFCTHLMLTEGRLHRIEAYIHKANAASLRLASKCGYFHEGTATSYARLGKEWVDMERFVILAQD